MTLGGRNKILIFTISLITVLTAIILFFIIRLFFFKELSFNFENAMHIFNSDFFLLKSSFYISILSIFSLLLYAVITGWFVYIYFEKTKSIEVVFFVCFLVSCAIESIRVFIPILNMDNFSSPVYISIGRIIFFSRMFQSLSLLFSSIFINTEKKMQQVANNIYIILALSIIFAMFMPIQNFKLYSNFSIPFGYANLFTLIQIILGIITFISFLLQFKISNNIEYKNMALGFITFISGYTILLFSENLLMLLIGLPFLSIGTFVFLNNIHKYYLWK